jgi:hypothetical protein
MKQLEADFNSQEPLLKQLDKHGIEFDQQLQHARIRFASAIEDARAQLLEYQDWFEDKDNRAKLIEGLGIEIYRPRLGVIIGTNQDFRSVVERQKVVSRYPDIDVVTYDDIVQHAHQRLLLVKNA